MLEMEEAVYIVIPPAKENNSKSSSSALHRPATNLCPSSPSRIAHVMILEFSPAALIILQHAAHHKTLNPPTRPPTQQPLPSQPPSPPPTLQNPHISPRSHKQANACKQEHRRLSSARQTSTPRLPHLLHPPQDRSLLLEAPQTQKPDTSSSTPSCGLGS